MIRGVNTYYMNSFASLFTRFANSALGWSWVYNGVRLANAVLIAPLLFRKLSEADYGMFTNFWVVAAIVPMVDFGFSVSIGRFVSYAMGGADTIASTGTAGKASGGPNYVLVWQLLHATQRLYRWLSIVAFVVIGGIGTIMVAWRINETVHPLWTWVAWGVMICSSVLDIYFGWWNTFLQGMNQVRFSARLGALANMLRLALALVLLLLGLGLLALPMATLVSSLWLRQSARKRCLELLRPHEITTKSEVLPLLRKIWPNTWRMGIHLLSGCFRNLVFVLICNRIFDLAVVGSLGFSMQITAAISGISAVWTAVKWPIVGQQLARQEYAAVRKTLWNRYCLQFLTFSCMTVVLIPTAPVWVNWISSGKHALPIPWLALLALNAFLDLQFTFWTTLICLDNRLPFLWPTVLTNVSAVVLLLVLLNATSLGVNALVLAPLIAGLAFNYWYWMIPGAKTLRVPLWRFVFCRQT